MKESPEPGALAARSLEGTLGVNTHRVPSTPVHLRRAATLAAWSRASVSTALTTCPLAREEIAVRVHAAYVALCHTHVTAAAIFGSTLEWVAMAVVALRWRSVSAFEERCRGTVLFQLIILFCLL